MKKERKRKKKVSHHGPLSGSDLHPAVTAVLCIQRAHHGTNRGAAHQIDRDSRFSQCSNDAHLRTTPEKRKR